MNIQYCSFKTDCKEILPNDINYSYTPEKNHVIIIAYHLYIYPSRRTPKKAISIDTKKCYIQ